MVVAVQHPTTCRRLAIRLIAPCGDACGDVLFRTRTIPRGCRARPSPHYDERPVMRASSTTLTLPGAIHVVGAGCGIPGTMRCSHCCHHGAGARTLPPALTTITRPLRSSTPTATGATPTPTVRTTVPVRPFSTLSRPLPAGVPLWSVGPRLATNTTPL